MFCQARLWKVRPSEIVGITNDYEAYCFDSAISEWGMWIESELDKVKGKNSDQIRARREARLRVLLSGKDAQQYADPAMLMKRKG